MIIWDILQELKMNNIIRWFIERPKVVNLLMLFIFLFGSINLLKTQNQGYPPVDFGVVNITTVYPGASPEDVEVRVTTKIEEQLKSVTGINYSISASMENISSIGIILEEDAEYDATVDDIQKAVNRVTDLPSEVTTLPAVVEVNNDRVPIIEFAITGSADYTKKRTYARSLEDSIRTIDSVGNIEKLGYLEREMQINVDQSKLDKHYLSLMAIADVIRGQNLRLSGGNVQTNPEKKVLVNSEILTKKSLEKVIVRSGFEGNRVMLTDVARIIDGYKKSDTIYRVDGDESINLIIYKKESADILLASKEVREVVERFKETLPNNIQIKQIVDYSRNTQSLLDLVKNNAKLGLILVLFTLFIFLNFKVAFWTALGIPTSILFAFSFAIYFGITINFISLMGILIVLGLLVDDAIVVAENIYSYKEKGLSPKDAAIKGTSEVLWPVITTVATTIVAFSPFLAMSGIMGKFMYQMPIIVTLVLIGSLVESIFILPAHIAHSKVKKKSSTKTWFDKLGGVYERFVIKSMRYRWVTLFVFILMFAFSIVLLKSDQMKFVLFGSDEGDFGFIKFETVTGSSLEDTAKLSKAFEDILVTYPDDEVISFVTTIGEKTPAIDDRSGNVVQGSYGNIIVHIMDEGRRARSTKSIMDSISEQVMKVPGFKTIEVGRIQDGPPVGKAVTLTVISNDNRLRNTFVRDIKSFLSQEEGVSKIEDNEGVGKKTVTIKVNQDLASRLGVNSALIASTVRTAFDGLLISSVRQNAEEINFRLQLNKNYQSNIDTISQLKIKNYNGKLVPLGQLVSIEEEDDVLMINHYDGDRSVTIYADVDREIQTSLEINQKLKDAFLLLSEKTPDLRLEFGGEEKNTQESMKSLGIALILALFGIYSILVILYDSFSQPFIVMISIPFAFSGVVYTFYLHRIDFGFMAIIGLIGLTGIIVNDALVMISMLNQKRDEGDTSIEGLAQAARRRLRPILLTTFTTAAGLFPTAYGFGGDNAFLVPMVMSVAWGLVFATIITLILVPSLYVKHHEWRLGAIRLKERFFGSKE
jgi:multidrug efflux pump subunit AcrB